MIFPLRLIKVILMAVLLQLPGISFAHSMAPVLITINQLSDAEFRVVWSFSRGEGAIDPTSLNLSISPNCTRYQSGVASVADNRWLREEHYECGRERDEALTIRVHGLQLVERSAVVRVMDPENHAQIHILDEQNAALTISPSTPSQSAIIQYLVLGVEHILEGADHLLFVIALCFLARGRIPILIGLITAFTLAHSITLSSAALGWVKLPERPVEAMIALSIALVAVELVRNSRVSTKGIMHYWPIVFVFGLLHGLGFAGALLDLGLPAGAFLSALVSFNLGVELGQLGLVLACAALISLVVKFRAIDWLNPAVGVGVGCTAGFWFVSRVV